MPTTTTSRKRSRATTNPYCQLPYVLKIHCLQFLDKTEKQGIQNYGYFEDDCMRKIYRIFGYYQQLNTEDLFAGQALVESELWKMVDLFAKPKTTLMFKDAQVLSVNVHIDSVDKCLDHLEKMAPKVKKLRVNWPVLTMTHNNSANQQSLPAASNNNTTESRMMQLIQRNAELHLAVNYHTDLFDAGETKQAANALKDYVNNKHVKTVTYDLDFCNSDDSLATEIYEAVKNMPAECKQKLYFDVCHRRPFGIEHDEFTQSTNTKPLYDTPEFWQVIGPHVRNIEYLGGSYICSSGQAAEFFFSHILPTTQRRLDEILINPSMFNGYSRRDLLPNDVGNSNKRNYLPHKLYIQGSMREQRSVALSQILDVLTSDEGLDYLNIFGVDLYFDGVCELEKMLAQAQRVDKQVFIYCQSCNMQTIGNQKFQLPILMNASLKTFCEQVQQAVQSSPVFYYHHYRQ